MMTDGGYSYRRNFTCKEGNKRPKLFKVKKLKLIDLLRGGYQTVCPYDDDFFASMCQFLMKKGYPVPLKIGSDIRKKHEHGSFQGFISHAIFSVCPFLAESLYVNNNYFHLFKWREQFDIFSENTYEGLNFYRNRASIPIKAFTSFSDIKKLLFDDYKDYKLKAQFNSQRESAVYILGKHINIYKDYFCYVIEYGENDDYEKAINGNWGSSWEIRIISHVGENYIDFCLRLWNNYEAILAKDPNIIELDSNYNYKLIG